MLRNLKILDIRALQKIYSNLRSKFAFTVINHRSSFKNLIEKFLGNWLEMQKQEIFILSIDIRDAIKTRI